MSLDLPPRAAGPVALAHVTVVPMDSERRLPDHTVVVEDGFIKSVKPGGAVPHGCRVVDCKGMYAMPGLADMYTHYWDPADAPLYLASGITVVRTVATPFQLAMGRIAERGEFPSPRLIALSQTIDGVGPNGRTDMPRGMAMTRPDQASGIVQRFERCGYHQLKAFSLLTAENLKTLTRTSLRVSANCPNAMTFEEAADAGVYCLDQLHNVARGHMRGDAPQPAFWDRFDPVPGTRLDFDSIRRLARHLAERGIWNVPTLVFHQRGGLPPEEAMTNPALKYVAPSSIRDWESTLTRWARRARIDDVDEWRSAARERARAFLEVVRIFHEEGVPLLAGSDSLNPWNVPGESLHQELANFVAAGMTPYAALRCATREAARFLGESERWGTLAEGRRADLVVLRSDPLRNVGAVREVEAVLVNGYYLSRAALDRMLEQRAELASSPPALPATDLPGESTWEEKIVGAPAGRIAWRHSRLPDGGWRIEERHASALPRRHVERRNTTLVLDREFKLQSCEYSIDSFAGAESATIVRTSAGYSIHHRDVDGWESHARLDAQAMLPSERLTQTLWSVLFSEPRATQVLDVDGARQMSFTRRNGHDWVLSVSRPTHVTEQLYRFSESGAFLGMQETMPLLWLRELIPE